LEQSFFSSNYFSPRQMSSLTGKKGRLLFLALTAPCGLLSTRPGWQKSQER
jgi:hypothetical protein